MKECIRKWVSSLQKNPSILLLIQSKEMLVCFDFGQENVYISFFQGKVELRKGNENQQPDIRIKGNMESFEKLLTGHDSLRKLVDLQQISIQSSFRKILLLESLFQLAHSKFISESSKNILTTLKIV